jgi:hypothetical protein
VRRDGPSAGYGTYYNLDEPLVYLRVGFSNNTWVHNFTNDQAVLEVRVGIRRPLAVERFQPAV